MKMTFSVRVPMCRLLSVLMLAFARSFFAFCAIIFDSNVVENRRAKRSPVDDQISIAEKRIRENTSIEGQ